MGNKNSNQRKGYIKELKSKKYLESLNYAVMRSAGSRGLFDLAAMNGTELKLVQVKSNQMPPQKDIDAMLAFECPSGTIKEIHLWYDNSQYPVCIPVWLLNEKRRRRRKKSNDKKVHPAPDDSINNPSEGES